MQRVLALPTPQYRHHFLFLEPKDPSGADRSNKLAKLHGSIPFSALSTRYSGEELCGLLARAATLVDAPGPVRPRDLFEEFRWARVRTTDVVATFDDATGLVFES